MAYSSTITFSTATESGTGSSFTINAESVSFGFENTTSIGSASGGAGAGKVTFSAFTFTKAIDANSAALYEACFTGTHFSSVMLTIQPAGAASPIIQYKFGLVYVSQIEIAGNQHGGATPIETVALEYGAVDFNFPSNTSGSPINGGWNQVTNSPSTSDPGID